MKIVLFPSAYYPAVGGVEELTARLAEYLRAAGEEVQVWTNRHPTTLPERETLGGIQVRRFTLPMPGTSPRQVLTSVGAIPAAFTRLARAVAATAPDLIHVQCFSNNGVYAAALSRMLRVPLVVSLQGETVMDDNDVYEHSVALRVGLRFGIRQANAVTACSRFVIRDAEQRFGLATKSGIVVPNGVERQPRAKPVPLRLPFEQFVFGLGRAVDKKGFDLLLLAYKAIADSYPNVGLVIGGDGPARQVLAERIDALRLGGRVALPGALSRGQVQWAMGNAKVFVLPSKIEPFGIVVLEAMRAGRPVVVSSRGGAGEIVQDGINGLVVDPFDTETFAAAIRNLLDDAPLRSRFAAAAKSRVRGFWWESISERYREIYRSAGLER